MAEIEGLVRALREGDGAKTAVARALGDLAYANDANRVLIAEAGGIPPLVDLLRTGSAKAKKSAAWALRMLTRTDAYQAAIAEAGGIPPLVEHLRDGSAEAKLWAARALRELADNNPANKVLIVEASGIPPLVELLRDGSQIAKYQAAHALRHLALNNAANAVAIAVTVGGLEALVELARGGRVTVNNRSVVRNAGIAAKRKSALVVAALLRDCVPEFKSAPGDIKDAIGSFL